MSHDNLKAALTKRDQIMRGEVQASMDELWSINFKLINAVPSLIEECSQATMFAEQTLRALEKLGHSRECVDRIVFDDGLCECMEKV
jgi:hypothetical protein